MTTPRPYTMDALRSMYEADRIKNVTFDDMLELARELPKPDKIASRILGSPSFLRALKTWIVTSEGGPHHDISALQIYIDKKMKRRAFKIVANDGSVLYEGVLPTQRQFRRNPDRNYWQSH